MIASRHRSESAVWRLAARRLKRRHLGRPDVSIAEVQAIWHRALIPAAWVSLTFRAQLAWPIEDCAPERQPIDWRGVTFGG